MIRNGKCPRELSKTAVFSQHQECKIIKKHYSIVLFSDNDISIENKQHVSCSDSRKLN